ncbi:hypothetical protein [Niabella ginsengisoli]|uniref:Uncharacterized protein n=1 Tax=Niabella ginsengisoli TaxID=522298 RepID=A0ABS9SGA3_9BACT|nr:hypothetical protein [Niabella ginsengisoli]MCH5597351.1 hypothetical protein [Niabella ginsengisoli]
MLHKTKLRLKQHAEKSLEILNRSSLGALVAAMVAALICILYLGSVIRTGLPFIIDLIIVILSSLLLTVLIFGLSYYLYRFIRKVNKYIIIAIIGTFVLTAILPDEKFNRPFFFLELICGILIGIGLNRRASGKERLVLLFWQLVLMS